MKNIGEVREGFGAGVEKGNSSGRGNERLFSLGVAVCGRSRGDSLEGGLVLFVARGEMIFERIHVRRKASDLTKHDGEVEGYKERDQMEAAIDHAHQERCEDNLVIRPICVKKGLPVRAGAAIFLPRHNGGQYEERYETSVKNGGKYHVAGRRCWCPSCWRSHKMIYSVHIVYNGHRRL